MEPHALVALLERTIDPTQFGWVLFEHGTFVIREHHITTARLEEDAIVLMRAFGPVEQGTPSADLTVGDREGTEGWFVTGHGPGMYTYVGPTELGEGKQSEMMIGLIGRGKRAQDGRACRVLHVSPRRT